MGQSNFSVEAFQRSDADKLVKYRLSFPHRVPLFSTVFGLDQVSFDCFLPCRNWVSLKSSFEGFGKEKKYLIWLLRGE